MRLSVLMPVFNESRTLREIVKRVLNSPVEMEIELVCVDDFSSDDSLTILRDLASEDDRIKVIAQPQNMGKGKAIRTAIEAMTGDIGIIQDADLEYDPSEYPKVIRPILDGDADAVYGSRFASSEVRRVLFFWHSLGNRLLTLLSNMANDLNLTDMETCYKAVRGDWLKRLRLTSDRFGLEPEITARLAQSGARIYEVPISYRGRTYAEGKTIGWRDGLEALWLIFKFGLIDTKHTHDSGHLTLESLGAVPSVTRWMLSPFKGRLGESVLEAGSGSGNVTEHLIDRRELVVIDIDPLHVASVRSRFGHLDNVTTLQADLCDPGTYEDFSNRFDSVVCINVLEHLAEPVAALRGFASSLAPAGKVTVLVPAHPWLFSAADEALGHERRYERKDLEEEFTAAGLRIETVQQFNRLGVFGWLVNKWLRRTGVGKLQARLFGLLLPVAKLVEKITPLPGLSWVVIAGAE